MNRRRKENAQHRHTVSFLYTLQYTVNFSFFSNFFHSFSICFFFCTFLPRFPFTHNFQLLQFRNDFSVSLSLWWWVVSIVCLFSLFFLALLLWTTGHGTRWCVVCVNEKDDFTELIGMAATVAGEWVNERTGMCVWTTNGKCKRVGNYRWNFGASFFFFLSFFLIQTVNHSLTRPYMHTSILRTHSLTNTHTHSR